MNMVVMIIAIVAGTGVVFTTLSMVLNKIAFNNGKKTRDECTKIHKRVYIINQFNTTYKNIQYTHARILLVLLCVFIMAIFVTVTVAI